MATRLSTLRRSGARLAVTAIVSALSLASAQHAHAVTTYTEDFEFGTTWTTTGGVGVDCTTANTGLCSLKVDPTCCSVYQTGSASLPVTSTTPIVPSAKVSFAFRGDDLFGDVDSGFTVKLDAGSVHLALTEGIFPNNGVALYGTGPGKPVGAWGSAGVWYTATLTFDGINHTVTATVPGVGSATAGISASATKITGLEAVGVRWSTYGWPLRYDTVKVDFPG